MFAVPLWAWAATVGGLVVVVLGDLLVAVRSPHDVSPREAAGWVACYVSMAAAFGGLLWWWQGDRSAGEFVAGYLTEYSLSMDNLFVFVLIMKRFRVPRRQQQGVLLYGIVAALVLRGAFIAGGAALVSRFVVVYYVFGGFLLYTAVRLARRGPEPEEFHDNLLLRAFERAVPTTRDYHGQRLVTRREGRRMATPLMVVMVAIGTTDLLFAVDSIPAIFGLTKQAYIVFTANAFALMGLRQLYFLLDRLLDRLAYLDVGLAFVLAFIGVKLVLEAAHSSWPAVPEVSVSTALAVVFGALALTAVASLLKARRDAGKGEP